MLWYSGSVKMHRFTTKWPCQINQKLVKMTKWRQVERQLQQLEETTCASGAAYSYSAAATWGGTRCSALIIFPQKNFTTSSWASFRAFFFPSELFLCLHWLYFFILFSKFTKVFGCLRAFCLHFTPIYSQRAKYEYSVLDSI